MCFETFMSHVDGERAGEGATENRQGTVVVVFVVAHMEEAEGECGGR